VFVVFSYDSVTSAEFVFVVFSYDSVTSAEFVALNETGVM
jgi:hypothetical protein